MYKEPVIIDGDRFSTLESFYDEVERKFTKDLGWDFGRNLDAFNDVLRGGFGIFEYAEPVIIIWQNADKSRLDLGWKETILYLEKKFTYCHPANKEDVRNDLDLARNSIGKTLFQILVDIIEDHEHIQLKLS